MVKRYSKYMASLGVVAVLLMAWLSPAYAKQDDRSRGSTAGDLTTAIVQVAQ